MSINNSSKPKLTQCSFFESISNGALLSQPRRVVTNAVNQNLITIDASSEEEDKASSNNIDDGDMEIIESPGIALHITIAQKFSEPKNNKSKDLTDSTIRFKSRAAWGK